MNFPLRHLSIRVPWHDLGWNGTVCSAPSRNASCLCLPNISESKNEQAEDALAERSISTLDESQFPPCVKERATFMAPFAFTRHHAHPYARPTSSTHSHFEPTAQHFPAYSAAALPFRWMNREFVWGKDDGDHPVRGLVEDFPMPNVSQDLEPSKELLGFESAWVQDARNHRELLDCFWNHIRVAESLVFFYAKQAPLVENPVGRILVGVGRVADIGGLTEYAYNDKQTPDSIRSLLWERMVKHTIRPEFQDGFLLPYHAAMAKAEEDPEFDPSSVVAMSPADRQLEFSYATEHVSPDGALASLLAISEALHNASESLEGDFTKQIEWIDKEMSRLWKQRGPCPGLGSVLGAMGVPYGSFVANEVVDQVGAVSDPWPTVEKALSDPEAYLPAELAERIDPIVARGWARRSDTRKAFIQLLSRFDISLDQARALYDETGREQCGIELNDLDFVQNPYHLYEATRFIPSNLQISVSTVDRGMFPQDPIRSLLPLPEPSVARSGIDERRLRALTISRLEYHAALGHTLYPKKQVISELRDLPCDPKCDVTTDTMEVAEDEQFDGEIRLLRLADDSHGYQLDRLAKCGHKISNLIDKRVTAPKHQIEANWEALLNSAIDPEGSTPATSERDQRARQEKIAALPVMANSRFSVLIGPAGTGKTTLLAALVAQTDIAAGGVLLLAPTGKARVRMQEKVGSQTFPAKTIAQFLHRSGRFEGATQRYLLTDEIGEKVAETVIIDECSMMTEEMLAATFEALAGVKRLILVGDHRQLPPIGPGKPFYDIVKRLCPETINGIFPKVSAEQGYAELTVSMRFGEDTETRDDIRFAGWFTDEDVAQGDDEILNLLTGARESNHLEILQWNSVDELHGLLKQTLNRELADGKDLDDLNFGLSLGGKEQNGHVYFNMGEAGKAAENWQILSPVRANGWGVTDLNRLLHQDYRAKTLQSARQKFNRRIPKPMGAEQIVYGDKIINNRNHSRRAWPKEGINLLANGEIGMVTGKFGHSPSILNVEFSTQSGYSYSFYANDFSVDGFSDLELAYALTVHRAQGSEFGTVFLILPKNRRMLTREMLYTALTRQRRKIVLLCEGPPIDLLELGNDQFSETKTRFTNLFRPPHPLEHDGKYLDANLIHQTERGELVRSKSEVIIADHLHRRALDYRYEERLQLGDDIRIPDFTIEDDDLGINYFWEHCGMLSNAEYAERWKNKQDLYREHGILPREEGGGPKGTLIITEDDTAGGISSKRIGELVDEIFG